MDKLNQQEARVQSTYSCHHEQEPYH